MITNRTHRIATIPGDGVGPEVCREAVRILGVVAASEGFSLDETSYDLGSERYLRSGELLPDSVLQELGEQDAILLGAVGSPSVRPGVLEKGLLLRLRQHFDLYANVRPATLFEDVPSPVSSAKAPLHITVVRENTEGMYAGRGMTVGERTPDEVAIEESVNTAPAVERIVRFAFDLARSDGHHVTLVHKTNVLSRSGELYRRIFEHVGHEYSEVQTDYQHVDAAALLLVQDPASFEVIVTDNLFGDILSDLTAALVGGIGMAASANIYPGRVSLFEPVHGSAPRLAGTGKANPIGAILSGALLLKHVGENAGAARIRVAVAACAGKAIRGGFSTSQIGDVIEEALA